MTFNLGATPESNNICAWVCVVCGAPNKGGFSGVSKIFGGKDLNPVDATRQVQECRNSVTACHVLLSFD